MMPNLIGVKALSLMPSLQMKKETLSFSKVYYNNYLFYYFSVYFTWQCQVKWRFKVKLQPFLHSLFFFFSGDHLWKGFSGPAELSNSIFKELDDYHHLGHVDAAFRMHHQDDLNVHDHIYFFLVLFYKLHLVCFYTESIKIISNQLFFQIKSTINHL